LVWFIWVISVYFRDKNQIEAKIGRAECLHRIYLSGNINNIDILSNVCSDINTYKIKSEYNHLIN
jgi:hypothetical protein